MSINLDAVIASPLGELQRRLDVNVGAGMDPKANPSGADYGLKEALQATLAADPAATAAIPLLTTRAFQGGAVKNHTLVRYRGMVQDMFEPEFFESVHVMAQPAVDGGRRYLNATFADMLAHTNEAALDSDLSQGHTRERVPLFCVPIPGGSGWCQPAGPHAAIAAPGRGGGSTRNKRQLDDGNDDGNDDMVAVETGAISGVDAVEIEMADDEEAFSSKRTNLVAAGGSGEGGLLAAGTPAAAAATASSMSSSSSSSSSGGGSGGGGGGGGGSGGDAPCCLVKLYDEPEGGFGGLKLNDVVEFIGILEADPGLAADGSSASAAFDASARTTSPLADILGDSEARSRNPPASLVPRLHCLLHRALSMGDEVDEFAGPAGAAATLTAAEADASRASVAARLAEALGGDALAAEYTLLAVASRVSGRVEGQALGVLPVNLSGFQPPAAAAAAAAAAGGTSSDMLSALTLLLAELLPRFKCVPVTTASLSGGFEGGGHSTELLPRKDYDANRLVQSHLQLSAGTVVLLDETSGLHPPSSVATATAASRRTNSFDPERMLDEAAKLRLATLREFAAAQELSYDFKFYPIKHKTEHPLLLASPEGHASLVDPSCRVVLQPAGPPRLSPFSSETELSACRRYLSAVRNQPARGDLRLADGVGKIAEENFVAARQANPKVGAQDLHRWLNISRLLAASYGRNEVSRELWAKTMEMETLRTARLDQATTIAAVPAGVASAAAFPPPATTSAGATTAMAPPPPPSPFDRAAAASSLNRLEAAASAAVMVSSQDNEGAEMSNGD